MEPARIAFALPDDPELVARVAATLSAESAPPVEIARVGAVLAFECDTWDVMLKSRVIRALEAALGPDWQAVVQPLA
jgi:hypothetical protein